MIGGQDSYGAGGYQKTPLEESLPVDMGVRDRQKQPDIALVVVIDKSGSMAACHCNTFDRGTRQQHRRRPQGRHRQGGDPAGRGGHDRARRARRRRLQRVRPLGRPHAAARRRSATCRASSPAIKADGQTNIYSGLDEAVKSLEGVTATRRHIILLTDGWSTSGQYDDILKQDEGRRDHPLDRRRGRRRQPVPRAARDAGRRPVLRRRPTRRASRTSSSRRPSRSPASRSSRSRSSRSRRRRRRSCAASTRACRSSSATTARPPSRPPRPCWSPRATIRSSPSGSTGSGGPWRGRRTRPGAGPRTGWRWPGFDKFFSPARQLDVPGRRDRTASRRPSRRRTGGRRCTSRASRRTARRATSTRRTPWWSGRTSSRTTSRSSQVAPGVYEATLGEVDPGAYAIRVTQTKPGVVAAGADGRAGGADRRRSTGCWGRTRRSWRSLRAATGGTVVTTALAAVGRTTCGPPATSPTCGRCC